MSETKTAARQVANLGRARSRMIDQRRVWIERRKTQPAADKWVAELDRELAINAEQLRAAKEALARAKKAGKAAPPSPPAE